jgi:hypothetical protein
MINKGIYLYAHITQNRRGGTLVYLKAKFVYLESSKEGFSLNET